MMKFQQVSQHNLNLLTRHGEYKPGVLNNTAGQRSHSLVPAFSRLVVCKQGDFFASSSSAVLTIDLTPNIPMFFKHFTANFGFKRPSVTVKYWVVEGM